MSVNEQEHAREWFARADTDLKSARLLADISGPPETICFLAQQGVEKYLKGYLVWQGVPFRKVHDGQKNHEIVGISPHQGGQIVV